MHRNAARTIILSKKL